MFKGKTAWLIAVVIFGTSGALLNAPAAGAKVVTAAVHPTPDKSLFSEYRTIKIGMAADAVRTKLGAPKDKSDNMDMFSFSESETAQFFYDPAHNVNAIMITFQGDVSKAPTAKDIFGEDVAPNDQGMIFKMERYPKAGYWISYTRTTGTDAMVNIALQKM